MRKIVFILAVALAVTLVAPPARATSFVGEGEYFRGSLIDRSSLFEEVDDGVWAPIGTGDTVEVGDEQRVLFKLDAVNTGTLEGGVPAGTLQVFEVAPVASYSNSALTGMLYDVVVTGFSDQSDPADAVGDPPTAADPGDIYFGPGARYSDTVAATGTDGQWTDTHIGAVTATTAGGFGGLVVVYDDPAINSNFVGDGVGTPAANTAGDDDWLTPTAGAHPGAGVMGVTGVVSNTDYFPTFSDVAGTGGPTDSGTAIPWLVAVIAPLPAPFLALGAPAGTLILEDDFDPNAGGDGFAFLNVIGGSAAGAFLSDVFGPGLDIRLDFEITIPIGGGVPVLTLDGWQVRSDDPVQWGGAVIPEPATMSLLGVGLLGLVAARRKKKK